MGISRAENMARIRAKDTAPELLLRRALWRRGLRYRLQVVTPAGRADIVFPGHRLAVYVDGCQWHGCPEHYVRPRSRTEFWDEKLASNTARDCRQTATLMAAGWRVLRLWEHEVFEAVDESVARVEEALRADCWRPARGLRVARVAAASDDGRTERRWLRALCDDTDTEVVVRERTTRKWRRG